MAETDGTKTTTGSAGKKKPLGKTDHPQFAIYTHKPYKKAEVKRYKVTVLAPAPTDKHWLIYFGNGVKSVDERHLEWTQ